MISNLVDLYQEVILDHNKKPRNFRVITQPTHTANGINPLCGDRVVIYLSVQDNVIKDIAFQGTGCAISSASASLMTELLKGKYLCEVNYLFQTFHSVVTTDCECPQTLGKLSALAGVRHYPSRVKCATLAWHTVRAALESGVLEDAK